MSKQKQHFTEEFKKQMVAMYNSGKSATAIAREYGMAKSTLHKWISTYNNSGSFKAKVSWSRGIVTPVSKVIKQLAF